MTLGLSVCFWNYDRTLALVDGRVRIAGCEARFVLLRPEDAFARTFADAPFDATELSFSNYMTAHSEGRSAYAAIPVFTSRSFRLASLFVRIDRGIRDGRDLKGRRVGLQEYDMTAALVVRGFLRDDYGLEPRDIRWSVGDVDRVRRERIPVPVVPGVEIAAAPKGATLDAMLVAGELDALVALDPPPSFRSGNRVVARLFPDWRSAERARFRRIGFFPIMHAVGIRKTLLAEHPWLARAVFEAFLEAKRLAVAELEFLQATKVTLPWAAAELEATRALMGEDFWPYGMGANRSAVEALVRCSFADGLCARRLTVEELFVPEMLDT